jgi:predicted transcriptional regulator
MKSFGRKTGSPIRKDDRKSSGWTFLTNHFHILVTLSRDPYARIRDLSDEVGITQRAVQRILAELVDDQVLKVTKEGRRNHYTINRQQRLRHPLENQHTIGDLLDLLS